MRRATAMLMTAAQDNSVPSSRSRAMRKSGSLVDAVRSSISCAHAKDSATRPCEKTLQNNPQRMGHSRVPINLPMPAGQLGIVFA